MPFKFLFCGKAEKEFYHVLDYSHQNLLNVPTEIYEHAQALENLYLDANQLKDLPKALFTLQHLKVLNISDNEVISLPSNVSNLVNLLEFDISKNGFLELPDSIKGMKSLEHFDLSVNPLGRLPDGFTMMLNLTHVYLNDTFLDFLPANIGRMAKLEVLEVRDNHLTIIPKSMSRLQSLRRLDVGNNEFNEVPEVIGTFSSLEELWLDGNRIKSLPPEIGNLHKLRYLDVTENTLEWIADELGNCISMTDLHLSTNNLVELPDNLCKLKFLETLKVDDNHLTHLPTSIGGLSNLEELICSSNELETIPPGIGLLRKLQTLNADENYIEELPDEIGSCIRLTVVSLRQNRLTYLPDEMGRLTNLAVCNLSSNMLEHLPYSMMKLTNLKALWLSENQAKPLIPLQTDWDETNEKRYLTCYMFPQRPVGEAYEDVDQQEETTVEMNGRVDQLALEEEWMKRTSVVFDIADDDPQVVRLSRQPTPFPKDIRDRITQFRNQAIAKGQVSNHHPPGQHVYPQNHMDEIEKLHAEQGHHSYWGHDMDEPHNDNRQYGGATEEEQRLLEQLQNTNLSTTPTPTERQHQQGLNRLDYNQPPHHMDIHNGHHSSVSPLGAPATTKTKFTVPVAPSPLSSRRYVSTHPTDSENVEEDFASVETDASRRMDMKLSADSGLGSSEIGEEQASWKNEYPAIPEQEEMFRVTIKKTPHLGFSVSGGSDAPRNPLRPDDMGIFITKVLPDGPAAGNLKPDDKLLEVNGTDFRNIKHEDAVTILKASDEVNLLVSRRLSDQT